VVGSKEILVMGPEWGKASFDDLVPTDFGLLVEEFVI
jgi:hypothetical protein